MKGVLESILFLLFLLCLSTRGEVTVKYIGNLTYQEYKNQYRITGDVPSNMNGELFKIGEGYIEQIIVEVNRSSNASKIVVEDVQSKLLELNENVIMIKVASRFRNNLIKAFGYILHRNNMELNSALYTSLYFILSTIKLNQINILSMVPILKELSFKTSNERFLKIFEAMEKHLPEYLRCAAAFWKEAIEKKEVDMDNILKPNDKGPLVVDILRGLDDEILSKIAKEPEGDEKLNEKEKKVFYNFNINIVQIMRYVQKHKNEINQFFFGALVLYFPRSLIQPDLEESIQVLIEYLDQNEIKEWTKYVSQLDVNKVENPYNIVEDVLHNLILDKNISIIVKDSVQIILSNLANRNPTAINPNYNSMANFVTLTNISIAHMIKYIQKGAYPTEIIIAGHRLIYYLEHGYMRYLSLLNNFNPYFYSSSSEVLVAILIRVIKRQPDLALEVSDSAGSVYSYLLFSIRYIQFPSIMPDDLQDVNVLVFGLRAPDIDQTLVQSLTILVSLMQKEHVAYQKVLMDIPVYKCSTPLMCFLELIKFLVANELQSDETMKYVKVILESSCYSNKCLIKKWDVYVNVTYLFPPKLIPEILNDLLSERNLEEPDSHTESTTKATTTSTTLTTTKSTAAPSEGPLSTPTTLKSTAATTPTGIPTAKDLPFNPTETVPSDSTVLIENIQNTVNNDTQLVLEMLKIMESDEFKATISKEHHLTIITMLYSMFHVFKLKIQDLNIREMLQKYKTKITHVQQILQLITTEKQPNEPILVGLIVAIPAPTNPDETKLFNQLALLLQKQELFALLHAKITNEKYRNVASLLKAVLTEEIKLKDVLTDEERKAASYYVDKIETLGLGQGKIEWGIKVDVIPQEINFGQIMDNGIGFNNLDKEKRMQFNSIIVYLREHSTILKTWDKWVYYTKCGDFTKALFNLLLNQGSLPPEIRKAVSNLTPLINFDKTGAKPSFGS